MGQVKLCLWNVQNYGGAVGDSAAARRYGPANQLRNEFIAQFVKQQGIELMMMMEAQDTAGDSLQDLLQRIGAATGAQDWMFAACGSALAAVDGAAIPPRGVNQVSYQADARSEGYAVFWRGNHPDYRLLKGLYEISNRWYFLNGGNPGQGPAPLNLVTSGRGLLFERVGRWDGSFDTHVSVEGGYEPRNETPCDRNGNPRPDWPNLPFATTGTTNPQRLNMYGARRPAYVVMKLAAGGGAGSQLCPVAVYHAPSRAAQASWGAYLAGLSRELYVTNQEADNLHPRLNRLVHCKNTVLGGDFNYGTSDFKESDYRYFAKPFGAGPETGAECGGAPQRNLPAAAQKTTVQILQDDHKSPITSNNKDDYFVYDIDIVFGRTERASAAERVNLLEVLENDGAGARRYGPILAAVATSLEQLDNSLVLPDQVVDPNLGPWQWDKKEKKWKPLISGSWGGTFTEYTRFKQEAKAGRLGHPRALAEYVHLFVSDHLPLTVTINF